MTLKSEVMKVSTVLTVTMFMRGSNKEGDI